MINAEKISLMRSKKPVLKEISFKCSAGRVSAFIGKSGAGKTSALRCIAGLEKDFLGAISCKSYDIKKLTPEQRPQLIGFVSQNYNLFPHLTAIENCTLSLRATLKEQKPSAFLKARISLE